MLTGHGGEESEVLCLEAGADDFVTKPINQAVCARASKPNYASARCGPQFHSKMTSSRRGATIWSETSPQPG